MRALARGIFRAGPSSRPAIKLALELAEQPVQRFQLVLELLSHFRSLLAKQGGSLDLTGRFELRFFPLQFLLSASLV